MNELLKKALPFLTYEQTVSVVLWDIDGRIYCHPDHQDLWPQADLRSDCPKWRTERKWIWETDDDR